MPSHRDKTVVLPTQAVDDFEALDYDLAVVRLREPVGLQTGWLGLSAACLQVTPQLVVATAGYPQDW